MKIPVSTFNEVFTSFRFFPTFFNYKRKEFRLWLASRRLLRQFLPSETQYFIYSCSIIQIINIYNNTKVNSREFRDLFVGVWFIGFIVNCFGL